MRRFTFRIVPAIAAVGILVSVALQAHAQLATPDRNRSEADQDLEERMAFMRYFATLVEKGSTRRKVDPKLAVAELQDDFTRIQIINKDLVLRSSQSKELDTKFVGRSAAEINKRASRLLLNLALPDPPADITRPKLEPISDLKQLRATITALGWKIYRFTKNPMFKEAGVIDAQTALRVRFALDDIVELSLQIKKSSEQLGKNT